MNKRLAFAAAAVLALAATPGLAQTPKADPATPPSTSATPPADDPTPDPAPSTSSSTPSASSVGADASVTTGMAVKDNTGATIGSIADLKTGTDGKKTATIKMGADTFAVDASALAVADGATTVNASHAEIKGMLKKK